MGNFWKKALDQIISEKKIKEVNKEVNWIVWCMFLFNFVALEIHQHQFY